jgi:hypothetical protein
VIKSAINWWVDLILGAPNPDLDGYVSTTVPYEKRTTLEA